ncbi:MAG: hypothetical protein V3V18_06985 [Methylococcales bacterium]
MTYFQCNPISFIDAVRASPHPTNLPQVAALGQCAEKKWRQLRGFNDLGKVIAEVEFKDGIEVTEDSQSDTA